MLTDSKAYRRFLVALKNDGWTACQRGKKDWDSDMNESTDDKPMKEEIDR